MGNNSIRDSYRSSYSYPNYVKCSCNDQSINGNNLIPDSKYYNVDIICKHFSSSCLDQYLVTKDTYVKFICHCKNSIHIRYKPLQKDCVQCKGIGYINKQMIKKCNSCDGIGGIKCRNCGGSGFVDSLGGLTSW